MKSIDKSLKQCDSAASPSRKTKITIGLKPALRLKSSIPPATTAVIMSVILTLSAPTTIAGKTENKDNYPLIKGTNGNDSFIMQAGTQEYIGGLGADSYIYNSLPDLGNSPDTISTSGQRKATRLF